MARDGIAAVAAFHGRCEACTARTTEHRAQAEQWARQCHCKRSKAGRGVPQAAGKGAAVPEGTLAWWRRNAARTAGVVECAREGAKHRAGAALCGRGDQCPLAPRELRFFTRALRARSSAWLFFTVLSVAAYLSTRKGTALSPSSFSTTRYAV